MGKKHASQYANFGSLRNFVLGKTVNALNTAVLVNDS